MNVVDLKFKEEVNQYNNQINRVRNEEQILFFFKLLINVCFVGGNRDDCCGIQHFL